VDRTKSNGIEVSGSPRHGVHPGLTASAAEGAAREVSSDATPEAPAADAFEPSASARNLPRALDLVKAASDVRNDRIEALRREIRAGTYTISVEKLAAKLANQT